MGLIDFVNFYLIPGLVMGCIYALGAIGITLLFGILRFAHFAHGDLLTLGAYVGLAIVAGFGLNAWIVLIPAAALTALITVGIDRMFYAPLRGGPTIVIVIASFGVALMVRSLIQVIWGADVQSYATGFAQPMVIFDTLRIKSRELGIFAVTGGLVIGLHLFLTRTRLGKAMRAMSDNSDLARVTGINTKAVIAWTWIIGGGLAGAAGVMLGLDSQLNTFMGWDLLLPMFAAAVLGGIGQPMGALFGGMVVGIVEELSTFPWFGDQALISPDYKAAISFGILVVLLIVKPTGLFRGRLL